MTIQSRRVGLTDVTNKNRLRNVKNQQQQAVKQQKQQPAPSQTQRNSGIRRQRSNDEEPPRAAPAVRNSFGLALMPVDDKHKDDELFVAEYARSVFRSMREREMKYACDSTYMNRQVDITEKMRTILIDWLVEVHLKFKLQMETLYLTVNLIDRYLDKQSVSRNHLQLVGIVCMLIAAKYEEIYPPEIQDFIMITDKAYTRHEVLEMEIQILNQLEFNLTVPTSLMFLRRYLAVDKAEVGDLRFNVAHFLLEISLPEHSMMQYSPSHIAASVLYLTNRLFEVAEMKQAPSFGSDISAYTDLTEYDIRPCTKEILSFLCNLENNSIQAVHRKYHKFMGGEVLKSAPIRKVLNSPA